MSIPLSPGSCGPGRPETVSTRTTISATLTSAAQVGLVENLRGRAGCLEVRADLAGDVGPHALRDRFGGELLYTLRGARAGGAFVGDAAERHRRLVTAALDYDLVDLESGDLVPEVLERIPAHRRRLSWHGPAGSVTALRHRLDGMLRTPARIYLVAPAVTRAEDALAPLLFLDGCGRPDVTAFGTGPAGTWSRLLAPWLGAPVIYGRLDDSGEGVPTVDQLVGDFGFPQVPRPQRLYGIVGASVARSVSPRVHNAGYRELGLRALYLPFQVEEFAPFWEQVAENGLGSLGVPLGGATVVAPHKEAALGIAAVASDAARASGSANSLVRDGRSWRADTSNSPAVIEALAREGVDVAGCPVAVVGCGGAGRAAAVALRGAGAHPTLVNRGERRGRYASELLSLPFVPLRDFRPAGFPVVVHATPLTDAAPFDVSELREDATVLDMVYAGEDPALVAAARRRGLSVIDGWDVLLADAASQFHLMTGSRMPTGPARAILRAARAARRGSPPPQVGLARGD